MPIPEKEDIYEKEKNHGKRGGCIRQLLALFVRC